MADAKSAAKNPPKGNNKKAPVASAKPKEEPVKTPTTEQKVTKASETAAPSSTPEANTAAPAAAAHAAANNAAVNNATANNATANNVAANNVAANNVAANNVAANNAAVPPKKEEPKEIRGVIVSGLPPDYTLEELKELGSAYGRLTQTRLYKYDSATLTRQGYLQYNDKADAGYAAYMLEGKESRKYKLQAKAKNLSKDDFVPAQKKKQTDSDPKQKKIRIKKNPGALRFLSPLNPSTDVLRGIQPQSVQNQQLAFVPPSNETWTNFSPEAVAPAVHLPDASVDHRPRNMPHQNEEFDQDYVQNDNWSQPRNNNPRNNNNNRNNSGGGRGRGAGRGRGGRGRGGRGNGKGGRRTEYVPAENQVSDQQFNQPESVDHFQQQTSHQQNQRPQKQFKIKQQSDVPLESSPAPTQEPQVSAQQHQQHQQQQHQQHQPQQQQHQQQKTNPNAKKQINNPNPNAKRNNNKGGQSPAPQSPPVSQQSPAPVVDEYEIIITHLKTKDPKTKFRIPAEQHANFLAAIQQFIPQ